jgi:hypothetical protein
VTHPASARRSPQDNCPLGRISSPTCAQRARYSLNSETWRSIQQCRSPSRRWGNR